MRIHSRIWDRQLPRCVGAVALVVLLQGCLFPTDPGPPDTAKLELAGPGSSSLELTLSTDFLVVDGSVSFQEKSTDTIPLPFDNTYRLGEPARIYFSAVNIQEQAETFSMRVRIDGENWYNESRPLEPGESFEFVYRYNEPRIR